MPFNVVTTHAEGPAVCRLPVRFSESGAITSPLPRPKAALGLDAAPVAALRPTKHRAPAHDRSPALDLFDLEDAVSVRVNQPGGAIGATPLSPPLRAMVPRPLRPLPMHRPPQVTTSFDKLVKNCLENRQDDVLQLRTHDLPARTVRLSQRLTPPDSRCELYYTGDLGTSFAKVWKVYPNRPQGGGNALGLDVGGHGVPEHQVRDEVDLVLRLGGTFRPVDVWRAPSCIAVSFPIAHGDLGHILRYAHGPEHPYGSREARERTHELMATRVMFDVLMQLGRLHDLGYAHNNVQAGHVLLDEEGHCHLASFGAASAKDRASERGDWANKRPEAYLQICDAAWRDDLWATGKLLLKVLLGPEVDPFRFVDLSQDGRRGRGSLAGALCPRDVPSHRAQAQRFKDLWREMHASYLAWHRQASKAYEARRSFHEPLPRPSRHASVLEHELYRTFRDLGNIGRRRTWFKLALYLFEPEAKGVHKVRTIFEFVSRYKGHELLTPQEDPMALLQVAPGRRHSNAAERVYVPQAQVRRPLDQSQVSRNYHHNLLQHMLCSTQGRAKELSMQWPIDLPASAIEAPTLQALSKNFAPYLLADANEDDAFAEVPDLAPTSGSEDSAFEVLTPPSMSRKAILHAASKRPRA